MEEGDDVTHEVSGATKVKEWSLGDSAFGVDISGVSEVDVWSMEVVSEVDSDSDVASWFLDDSGEADFDAEMDCLNKVSGDVWSVGNFVEVGGDVVNAVAVVVGWSSENVDGNSEDCGSGLDGCFKMVDIEGGDADSVNNFYSTCLSWNCRHVRFFF